MTSKSPIWFKATAILVATAMLAGCLKDKRESRSPFGSVPASTSTTGTKNTTTYNAAPSISGAPPSAVEAGEAYTFQPSASDPDGDPLSFSIANKPVWANFDTRSGKLAGTPEPTDVGTTPDVAITVTDGKATSALPTFTVKVEPPEAPTRTNQAPTISGTPPTSVQVGDSYIFQPSAADADADRLMFSIVNKPGWASFDVTTGRLAGTPSIADVGTTENVIVQVTDGTATVALAPFPVTVTSPPPPPAPPPPNAAPTILGAPAISAREGEAYSFQPSASDKDGDRLTFTIQNKPAWASFNTSTGQLAGTPAKANVGVDSGIVISVSDGQATVSLASFAINVLAAKSAPTISGSPPLTVQVGQAYDFRPAAKDADGDPLTFSIQAKPSWANFDTTTGRLYGTPASANAGTYPNIAISVTDGTNTASLAMFNVTVKSAGSPPTISGTPPASAKVGVAYSFQPTAADADGDKLSFTVDNRPGWCTFDAATGRIYGTPTSANVGTYSSVLIQVSDGTTTVSLPAFSIAVASNNTAPMISGTPTTAATVGQAYSFQPAATDAENDYLQFSIQNKPAWATFDSATGKLSGTPTAGGTFSNITISVSDGTTSVALPAFAIAVAGGTSSGSATLSWQAPSQNTDGSSLTDLSGYRIYYGTSASALNQVITIGTAAIVNYTVSNLAAGTWYFAMTAINSSGIESDRTAAVSKSIQ